MNNVTEEGIAIWKSPVADHDAALAAEEKLRESIIAALHSLL